MNALIVFSHGESIMEPQTIHYIQELCARTVTAMWTWMDRVL